MSLCPICGKEMGDKYRDNINHINSYHPKRVKSNTIQADERYEEKSEIRFIIKPWDSIVKYFTRKVQKNDR
jgi:hypothetical protein